MRCLKLLRLLERQWVFQRSIETQSAFACSLEGLGGTYLLANVAPSTSPAALRRTHGDDLPCGHCRQGISGLATATSASGSFHELASPLTKVCKRCQLRKPPHEFRGTRKSNDGLQHTCIPCKAKVAGIETLPMLNAAPQAICSHCKVEKPAVDFYRNLKMKTGLTRWCKECINAKLPVRRGRLKASPG
ncbi:g7828 [Coccomyxa elongata]